MKNKAKKPKHNINSDFLKNLENKLKTDKKNNKSGNQKWNQGKGMVKCSYFTIRFFYGIFNLF